MNTVKVGVGRKCITPPMGTGMSGYFRPRFASGVLDDLYVTAVAFDDGNNRAMIISLDLSGLKNQEYQDKYKRMVSESCGISFEAIITNCSHTHTGPIVGYDKSSETESNPVYDELLGEYIRDAAIMACEDLKPARFFTAKGEVKNLAFVRLFRMKDGSVKTNPGFLNPDILCPIAEPDDTVRLLKITRDGGEDILITHFGVHADTIGGECISADFIGALRRSVEARRKNTVCTFLQGAEGDLNHFNVSLPRPEGDRYPRTIKMGERLADEVLRICDKGDELFVNDISYKTRVVAIPTNKENHRLPEALRVAELHRTGRDDEIETNGAGIVTVVAEALRIINVQNAPDNYTFTLSAIRLGSLVFAGLPGEPFCEIGKRIVSESPYDMTMVCALTDGGEIYFPTGNIYDEGGYEARSTYIKKGADDILVNNMVKLLGEL